ncbi:LAFA_0F20956g1_1 [Lachancea sp. 'fantastica']|nr:LAFA_0F20956g1_1 [Lachancea sp. 'fantastica']
MPRLKPSTFWKAYAINKGLPFLLPECRTISAAKQELRWISQECSNEQQILQCCKLRHSHYPLQYILKSQPFGPLDIRCKRGVLIPRWETEEWTMDLAQRLPVDQEMRLVDLCTGSGCIALLMKHLRPKLTVNAFDCSPLAIHLAHQNARELGIDVQIAVQNILDDTAPKTLPNFDLITCNPPYIPQSTFIKETSTSVKLFEPKLALLGSFEFYDNLIKTWLSKTDAFVYEVGGLSQCIYVHDKIAQDSELSKLWRVGFKFDSNKQSRVVYGYKQISTRVDWKEVFKGFGKLGH